MRKLKKRKKTTHTSNGTKVRRKKLKLNIKLAIILAVIAMLLICYVIWMSVIIKNIKDTD